MSGASPWRPTPKRQAPRPGIGDASPRPPPGAPPGKTLSNAAKPLGIGSKPKPSSPSGQGPKPPGSRTIFPSSPSDAKPPGGPRPPSGDPPPSIRPAAKQMPTKIAAAKPAAGGASSDIRARTKILPSGVKRPVEAASDRSPEKAPRLATSRLCEWQEDELESSAGVSDGSGKKGTGKSQEAKRIWWEEQQAKRQAELEAQRRKAEEQREEKRLAAQKRDKAQVLMKKLNEKVQAEDIDEAVTVAREFKDADLRPAPSMLQRLLEIASRRGSQSEFARALVVSCECGAKVDAAFFVRMLMSMVQRGCPQIMLRIALNMPLAPEAPVVSLLPPELDDEEEHQAFEDGEPLPADDKEKKDAKKDAKESKEAPPENFGLPLAMILVGCEARPELNGPYVFTDSYADYLEHDRPTYRKGENDYYVYYWQTDAEDEPCGWCIGVEVGGEDMLGYHPDTTSWVPPKSGWKFMRPGAQDLTVEKGGFVPPEEAPEEVEDPWPSELQFTTAVGGQESEVVFGTYKKTTEYGKKMKHKRPVYVKAGDPTLYVYFWCDEPDKPWKSGWWIGQEVGGDLVLGYNPEQSWVPPSEGWQINRFTAEGQCQRRPHRGGFYEKAPTEIKKGDDRFKSLEEVVRKIDLSSLRGMVQFPDSRTQAYFGHFSVLLHLEYLKELGQVRRRLSKRDLDQLVKFGWALDGLAVRAIFAQKWKGRYGALPGKATTGSEQVAFGLPSSLDPERCRIRRGDSVMISPAGCNAPLQEKVGEGVVNDINDWEMVIALEGHMPSDARKLQWRLDKSANHTAHERQLQALLKLAKHGADKYFSTPACRDHGAAINGLLLSAPVGLVDEWAVQMKERVDEMQKEKLKEKGLEAPEDTEEAWEKWLNTDTGGCVAQALDVEAKKATSSKKTSKDGKAESSAITIAELAAEGPPMDQTKLHAARRALSRMRDLNVSQRKAVNAALARRCTVIQGPPGTGKTHVSVKILAVMAREMGLKPLLATSDSNVAVDNMCQGLIADGIKAIRVGRPEKVRTHLEDITLEAALRRKKESLKKEAIEAEQRLKQVAEEAETKRLAAEAERKERLEAAKRKVEEAKAADAAQKKAKIALDQSAEKSEKKDEEAEEEEEKDADKKKEGEITGTGKSEAESLQDEPAAKRAKVEEPPINTDKANWLRQLLVRAEISEHFEKALLWVEETGCVQSDLGDDEAAEELIQKLELKKFAANRLKKAIAAIIEDASNVKDEKKEESEDEGMHAKVEAEEGQVKAELIDEAAQEAMDLLEQERKEREHAIEAKKKAAADKEKKAVEEAKVEQERKAALAAKVEEEKKAAELVRVAQKKRALERSNAAEAKANEEESQKKLSASEEAEASKDSAKDDEKADEARKAAEAALAEEESKRLAAEAKAQEEAIIKRQEVKKKQRMEDWELQMELINECEVICTTTISAGSNFLGDFHFETILVDEAAQATELSTIVPIVMRGANRVVIVGDHCQLPPSIMSLEAETRGLSVSIYSRLVGVGIEPYFLNTQYRSHPKIAEFSASAFYGGLLKSGTLAEKRPAPKGVEWPNKDVPVCFVEVPEMERRDGDTKINPAEAARVTEIIRNVLLAGELSIMDVGVVSPYMGQVRLLRQQLRQTLPNLLRKLWQSDWDGPWQNYDPRFLEIGTVDAYQGREKELIVFSAVRSNNNGKVGFLADWRRLNVMLTRSKRGLIVVGHAETLRYDPCWQQWLEWCQAHGCILKFGSAGAGAGVLLPGSASQEEFNQRLGPKGAGKGKKWWQGSSEGKVGGNTGWRGKGSKW